MECFAKYPSSQKSEMLGICANNRDFSAFVYSFIFCPATWGSILLCLRATGACLSRQKFHIHATFASAYPS